MLETWVHPNRLGASWQKACDGTAITKADAQTVTSSKHSGWKRSALCPLLVILPLLLSGLLGACAHRTRVGDIQRATVGDGIWEPTIDWHCLELLPELQLHRIRACESLKAYTFDFVGQKFIVNKQVFMQRLRKVVTRLLQSTAYPWRSLNDAEIEVWLVAPVFVPETVQFVAVVLSQGGNFAVRLPRDSKLWSPSLSDLSVLDKSRYPSMDGRQPGMVLVQASPAAIKEQTLARLKLLALKIDAQQWPLITLYTQAFAEIGLARAILQMPRSATGVNAVSLLPAGEPEAARGLAFRFDFKPKD